MKTKLRDCEVDPISGQKPIINNRVPNWPLGTVIYDPLIDKCYEIIQSPLLHGVYPNPTEKYTTCAVCLLNKKFIQMNDCCGGGASIYWIKVRRWRQSVKKVWTIAGSCYEVTGATTADTVPIGDTEVIVDGDKDSCCEGICSCPCPCDPYDGILWTCVDYNQEYLLTFDLELWQYTDEDCDTVATHHAKVSLSCTMTATNGVACRWESSQPVQLAGANAPEPYSLIQSGGQILLNASYCSGSINWGPPSGLAGISTRVNGHAPDGSYTSVSGDCSQFINAPAVGANFFKYQITNVRVS